MTCILTLILSLSFIKTKLVSYSKEIHPSFQTDVFVEQFFVLFHVLLCFLPSASACSFPPLHCQPCSSFPTILHLLHVLLSSSFSLPLSHPSLLPSSHLLHPPLLLLGSYPILLSSLPSSLYPHPLAPSILTP